MDLSKLKNTEKIIGVGALVGIISAFLPWWSWKVSVFGVSSGGGINGLNNWWMLSFVAAIASLLWVALPLFGVTLPKLGIADNILQMILGGVVGGIPVLAFLSGASSGAGVTSEFGSAGPSIGLFGAIAGGAIILFGAFTAGKGGTTPQTPQTPQEPQA